MLRLAGLGLVVCSLSLACGGRTETGVPGTIDDPTGSDGSNQGSGKGSGKEPGSGCDELHGQCDAGADTELGECKLGVREYSTSKPCPWVADGRCYDTREMACNCECPRDRDSQCLSGFGDGPNGHVLVECI
jgi:hypothetical protein